ncbi:MAG: hypothetical protein JWO91_2112 [Acidobacteriaceae bacterium]|nr:hypothetical protein [Acidobacteriaceae bacterium]
MGENRKYIPDMTIAKQALLTDLDYSAWANQRLLDACSALTAEELDRDLGASHGGVIRTLRHIYYAERVWMKRLRTNSLPPLHEVGDQRLFGDAPPEPGLEVLKKSWPEVWSNLREWLGLLPGRGTGQRTLLSGRQWRRSTDYSLEDYLAHSESLYAASRTGDWNAACVRQTAAQSRPL